MRHTDFYPLMRAKPFVPFRILRSDGTVYSIDTPRMILPTFDSVIVFLPHPLSSRLDGPIHYVPLSEVVKLESSELVNGIQEESKAGIGNQ